MVSDNVVRKGNEKVFGTMWLGEVMKSYCDHMGRRRGGDNTLVSMWLGKRGHEKCFSNMCLGK